MKNKTIILLPTYNNLEGLNKTLDSINLDVSKKDADILIVDDGSINPIKKEDLNDFGNIILLRIKKNSGLINALNTGLEYILKHNYEYIARIDAGDLWVKDRLKKQFDFMNKNPKCVLLGVWAKYLEEGTNKELCTSTPPADIHFIRKIIHAKVCFIHSGVMFRSKIFNEVGFYSKKYQHAEDMELFFRIAKKYYATNIPEFLLDVVNDTKSVSNKNKNKQLISRLKIQLKYFNPFIIYSYLGIGITLGFFFFSRNSILKFKKIIGKK